MMHFSGSHGALSGKSPSGEKPRTLAAALRAPYLQVCPHTTLLPYKKPVSTCVNTGLTCMLCGTSSPCTRSGASRPCLRLPLEPAVGLLVGGADVAHGTADALGVASSAGFSPKVNPLLVDVFPELVGEKREQVLLGG